eukprot:m.168938 g.168938  ORF g.168938 m.168938 type:complete len:526 (-) comp14490_c1_seq2:2407-3984(-)
MSSPQVSDEADGSRRRAVRSRFDMRSKSMINPAHVQQVSGQRKRSMAERRARNKTTVVSKDEPAADEDEHSDESDAMWRKVAEMRGDIMQLQKQHIVELQKEIKGVKQENDQLVITLAASEQELGNAKLEMQLISGEAKRLLNAREVDEEEDTTLINDLMQERDEALEKLSNVLSFLEELTRTETPSRSVSNMQHRPDILTLSGDSERDGAEDGAHSGIGARPDVEVDTPVACADDSIHAALSRALKCESIDQKVEKLNALKRRLQIRWHESSVSEEVSKQNAELMEIISEKTLPVSAQIDSVSYDYTRASGQLRNMQQRLRPQLSELVLTSNDLRIRSSAIQPQHGQQDATDLSPAAQTSSYSRPMTAPQLKFSSHPEGLRHTPALPSTHRGYTSANPSRPLSSSSSGYPSSHSLGDKATPRRLVGSTSVLSSTTTPPSTTIGGESGFSARPSSKHRRAVLSKGPRTSSRPSTTPSMSPSPSSISRTSSSHTHRLYTAQQNARTSVPRPHSASSANGKKPIPFY